MDAQGILHGIRGVQELDEAPDTVQNEAPGAYKDISEIIRNQSDLVDVLVELSPMGVIKG